MKKKLACITIAMSMLLMSGFFVHAFAGESDSLLGEAPNPVVPMDYNEADLESAGGLLTAMGASLSYFDEQYPQQVHFSKGDYQLHFIYVYSEEPGTSVKVDVLTPRDKVVTSTGEAPVMLDQYDEGTGMYMGMALMEHAATATGQHEIRITDVTGDSCLAAYFGFLLPKSYSNCSKALLGKGELLVSNSHKDGYSWFKLNVTKNGYVKIKMQDSDDTAKADTYGVRLYDAQKKKCLSGGGRDLTKSNKYTTYYGLKKGTYYLRVYNRSADYFAITGSQYGVMEKSGAIKAKAVKVGKNVLKKGTVLATETAATSVDWYKITTTKAQKVYLHLNFKTGGISKGGVKVSVYKAGATKPMMTKTFASGESSHDWKIYTKNYSGKLKKGTYYIKVQKNNYGNGYYSLKWNNSSK